MLVRATPARSVHRRTSRTNSLVSLKQGGGLDIAAVPTVVTDVQEDMGTLWKKNSLSSSTGCFFFTGPT